MLSELRRGLRWSMNLSDHALRLYRLLMDDGRSEPDWSQVRYVQLTVMYPTTKLYSRVKFRTECLIYIPATSRWVSPAECLWDSPVPINGKEIILQSYPEDLKAFFLERLHIPPASLTTLVEELYSVATPNFDIQRLKQLFWAINGMKPRQSDMQILQTCNFLPVRIPSQRGRTIELQDCQSDFVIIDRIKLQEIFENQVEMLDFDLEEVLQLEPLISALNLGSKYISQRCREDTGCQGDGLLDAHLTADFHERAYDLLR